MARNRQRLSRAVRLLEQILLEEKGRVEYSNQGSSRELLANLYRLKELLVVELQEPSPDWMGIVVPLLRETAKWLGEIINNYRYEFSRFRQWKRQIGIDLGTWVRDQVLPVASRT